MSKNKPSLYKGDYYTPEEYTALHKLLVITKNLIESLLFVHTEKTHSKNIKKHIQGLNQILTDSDIISIYNLIYNTPLEDIPLFLNTSDLHRTICQWRLQINK
jgi:hypothetical protein